MQIGILIEDVREILAAMHSLLYFASVYWLTKCLKSMLCGMILMPVIFLFRKIFRNRSATARCYFMLLLLPMTFMGMSRLFYQRPFIKITAFLSNHVNTWQGYFYFLIMLVLAVRFVHKNWQLRRQVKHCVQITDISVINKIIHTVTWKDWGTFQKWYLHRVKIYIADTNESPFAGGIVMPYIVMPRVLWEGQNKENRDAILCHELMHIKSGHILWLTLFKFLTFLWWVNPFIYLCESALKEDIELACDESCILYAGISKQEYSNVLLTMIEQLYCRQDAAAASFIGRSDFTILKKRIGYIAGRNNSRNFQYRKRICFGMFAACIMLVFMVISITSYPRYTVIRELTVYDETVCVIADDTPLVRETFSIENGELCINQKKFEEFIKVENITDEYVYVSFDTIMKLPGMGGLGNVGMVNVSDTSDIFYLGAPTLSNKIMTFCLKYLI